jgi:hypothetical protein
MAKVSILLENLAKQLENPDSELVLASEDNEDVLNITTLALVNAANILRTAAEAILKFEPHIEAEDLDGLAEIAAEFDKDDNFSKYSDSIDNLIHLINKNSSIDKVFNEDILKMSLPELYEIRKMTLNNMEIIIEELENLERSLSLEKNEKNKLYIKNDLNNKKMKFGVVNSKLNFIDKVVDKLESTSIHNAAKLAEALDESGDDKLAKVASVLDEILLTIGTPKGAIKNIKSAEESEIEKLRLKYKTNPEELFAKGNEGKEKLTEEYTKAIKEQVKVYKPMEHGLSSRYCPDHNGCSLMRVADNTWQCNLDKKLYNYEEGYKLMDGSVIPGSNVSNQTQNLQNPQSEHVSFSTRSDKLNENNG